MAANAVVVAIGANDHRHRVPADDAFDAPLDFAIARIGRLFVGGNCVDVGSRRDERQVDASLISGFIELREQIADALGAFAFENVAKRFEPLLGFSRVGVDHTRARLLTDKRARRFDILDSLWNLETLRLVDPLSGGLTYLFEQRLVGN